MRGRRFHDRVRELKKFRQEHPPKKREVSDVLGPEVPRVEEVPRIEEAPPVTTAGGGEGIPKVVLNPENSKDFSEGKTTWRERVGGAWIRTQEVGAKVGEGFGNFFKKIGHSITMEPKRLAARAAIFALNSWFPALIIGGAIAQGFLGVSVIGNLAEMLAAGVNGYLDLMIPLIGEQPALLSGFLGSTIGTILFSGAVIRSITRNVPKLESWLQKSYR